MTDEFKKTTRLTAYLTQENILFADAAKAIDGGGISARLNGVLQRYPSRKFFKEKYGE